ncbi:MAG: hypothetical protein JWQ27_559 [Ferruginibacter sp.]|nr:hypothetical protein [Ferruginibacter sp.]
MNPFSRTLFWRTNNGALKFIIFLLLLSCSCFSNNSFAQANDTLPAVRVQNNDRRAITALPLQQMNRQQIQQLNSVSVAEALRFFSGVLLKDYGGLGGLKTVSVRSLGANHTAVLYNGLPVSEGQSGQVDLGKITLDNIQSISLYNGQSNQLLLPARAAAAASVLMIQSDLPVYDSLHRTGINASLLCGGFGYISPYLQVRHHFSKRVFSSINGGFQQADGDYRFDAYEADGRKAKRHNGDIKAGRLEHDLLIRGKDSMEIRVKNYYYSSDRGLPGAVIFFNSINHERLKDENFFSQASFERSLAVKTRLLLNGKYNYSFNRYTDPDYLNSSRGLENIFTQQEWYGSAAVSHQFNDKYAAGFATDYFYTTLKRRDSFALNFADPKRKSWLANLSAKADWGKIDMQAGLLFSLIKDQVKTGNNGRGIDAFTPTIAASWQPARSIPLRIRAFYKNVFRAPTFNDLYYTNIGNSDLRAEYAQQYNLGLTYEFIPAWIAEQILFTADAYYNDVKDKILAVPRLNLYQWSMMNIGKVDIRGLDAALAIRSFSGKKISWTLRGNYTFQLAKDVSDKSSGLYNTQLPYTPKHSGSINLFVNRGKFGAGYNGIFSALRYRLGDPTTENRLQGWATQDVNVHYAWTSKKNCSYTLIAEFNNLFNTQYEIIKYYPMPGFNFRAGIAVGFNPSSKNHTHKKTT